MEGNRGTDRRTQGSEGLDLTPPVGERDRVRGPAETPVTLVEFGDYDCPYTVRAYSVVRGLRRRLGDRMRFVFRVFPLTQLHEHAQSAAEAAEAAAAQGKFWEMHDRLFEAHRRLADQDLRSYAREVGLDGRRFDEELAQHAHAHKVREDLQSALRSGAPGTPAFFINGVRHQGAHNLKTLLAAIEDVSP
ncbi:MAG: DsbA family protein [Actinomycetota bacterium]|nr:DsbA family protein [Actinomycetota bacterium]